MENSWLLDVIFSVRMWAQGNHVFIHSSLLSVFSLNATSPYNSYLPLIFGKFAVIWGHFQNILTSRFWGRWGRWGQTTSKPEKMKIFKWKPIKTRWNPKYGLSHKKWPLDLYDPGKGSVMFLKIVFLKSVIKLRKMSYSLAFYSDF